jgi:hypothetical protein
MGRQTKSKIKQNPNQRGWPRVAKIEPDFAAAQVLDCRTKDRSAYYELDEQARAKRQCNKSGESMWSAAAPAAQENMRTALNGWRWPQKTGWTAFFRSALLWYP